LYINILNKFIQEKKVIKKIKKLKKITSEIKLLAFEMLNKKGGGHYGGSFSCAEILVNIFFFQKKPIDHFILSKAHAGVIYYSLLAKKKIIPLKYLKTYGAENSKLGVHGEHDLINNIEFSCGSLGHGLSYACGLSLGTKKRKRKKKIFVILGDGECQEGSVWEAAMFAGHHSLSR
jgi:transketolase